MIPKFDPSLDLKISRIIKAPRETVWRAWTEPRNFEKWWVPAPAKCRVTAMELRPGGAFTTEYSEDGIDFGPHVDGCFLAIDEMACIVFTDALLGGWRPSERPFMTAVIGFADHPEGTDYAAWAMHKSPADRDSHEEMGFYDGWGTVAEQFARMVEGGG